MKIAAGWRGIPAASCQCDTLPGNDGERILASILFGLYVMSFGSYNKTYGALAGVIVFLLWLWITNLALLFGAELHAELERGRQLQAGIAAEEDLQMPPRDTRVVDKTQDTMASSPAAETAPTTSPCACFAPESPAISPAEPAIGKESFIAAASVHDALYATISAPSGCAIPSTQPPWRRSSRRSVASIVPKASSPGNATSRCYGYETKSNPA